jgi:hypothetical protein
LATESITDGIVDPIGLPATVNTTYDNKTHVFDIAVSGEPYYLAASNKYPYHRETASYKRTQLDTTQQPGEQTFEGWWLRSQGSFHLGAGIKFLEPLQGQDVIYRFNKSVGVDVWTPGEVTLLSDTTKVASTTNGTNIIGAIDGNNVSCVIFSDGANLKRIDSSGTVTSVTYGGSGSDIVSITQDGTNYYVANATGIYKGLLTGVGTGTKIWNTGTSKVVIGWVKQRLIAGIGATLYFLPSDGTGGPTLPTGTTPASTAYICYTHPNASWLWTAISEGPTGVYAAGYAGTASSIIKLTLDNTGNVPYLTSAVSAADFPDDEHVTSFAAYLGKFALIGTNKGVRVGTIDSSVYGGGYITYGPLTYNKSDTTHVNQFAFRDRFAYATVTNDIDGSSGLIRIDLSAALSDGKFGWTYDLNSFVSGNCDGVAFIGETGLAAFIVDGQGVYFQHATNKVASGYIDTGAIRYNTMEKKHFKLVKVRVKSPMNGSVSISTITKSGSVNSIITIANDSIADQDFTTNLETSQEQLAFRFTLNRSTTDATTGGGIIGYQIKALPANKRTRSISIPLMCYDFESDRYNIQTGYEGRAWDRLLRLENIEGDGNTVTIQDFTTGEQVEGLIEKVSFDRVDPPDRRFKGFGGIVYVQVRTI